MTGSRTRLAAALWLLGVAACGGGTDLSAPPSGPLELVLHAPESEDGIALIEVTGGAVDSVTAAGYRLEASTGSGPRRLLVSGELVPGRVARIWVPDRTRSADYQAEVLEVAARGTYELRDAGRYRVDVVEP